MYFPMNWRNPIHSQYIYNTADSTGQQKTVMNNLARVRRINGSYENYGYAEVHTVDWDVRTAGSEINSVLENGYVNALMYMRYGDYRIIMNSRNLTGNEEDKAYKVNTLSDELGLTDSYRDLISGKYYDFGLETAKGAELIKNVYDGMELDTVSGSHKMRFMLIESFETMKPLCAALHIENT